MDNNFENTPDNQSSQNQAYTDPNAGYQYNSGYHYYQGDNGSYHADNQFDMDQSPMTLGDWVLTILAWMIPCVGLVLYLVWAFGKNGNVNRRNFCRAWLIIYAAIFVLSVILIIVFGISAASLIPAEYYGVY